MESGSGTGDTGSQESNARDEDSDGSRKGGGRTMNALALTLTLVIVAGVVLRASRVVESSLFFWPIAKEFPTPRGAEDVRFASGDGTELHGWWLEARDGHAEHGQARGTVLFCHGNADSIESHIGFVSSLPDVGYNVFLFDYRGYGQSSPGGRLLREKLVEDSRAALETVLAMERVDPDRLVLMGHSMGAMAASNLAVERPVFGAVALVSAFSSWPGVAGDYVPVLGPALVQGGYDPERAVEQLGDVPLLIRHGDIDRIVRPRHAPVIADAARNAGVPIELVIVPDADHVSILANGAAQAEVAAFFDRALGNTEAR